MSMSQARVKWDSPSTVLRNYNNPAVANCITFTQEVSHLLHNSIRQGKVYWDRTSNLCFPDEVGNIIFP